MNTGENEQALRKIIDFTRLASIVLLALHFYIRCYGAFQDASLTHPHIDYIVIKIARFPLFHRDLSVKSAVLVLLLVSLIGPKGRKSEHLQFKKTAIMLVAGLVLYYLATVLLYIPVPALIAAGCYIAVTAVGYLVVLSAGTLMSRLIKEKLTVDLFNKDNESFPQEERKIENEYSVNIPAEYSFQGKTRPSYINVISPARGVLLAGSPGAGKSFYIVNEFIRQLLNKHHSMLVYDWKFPDLSKLAYNYYLKNKDGYPVTPAFYAIDFEDLSRTNRCNPLDPASMTDITDASESARTIMIGLNPEWGRKNGDFFVESAVNFVTAIIWFLRKFENGRFCTLPHAIELLATDYNQLFPILLSEPEIEVLVGPFRSAFENRAMAQLEGQIASAKIGLARLASPQLYYVMSGNDFTLDINNPKAPKILCLGNNPPKHQIYGAVISLYINRLIKLVNRKGQMKSALIIDEFPTIQITLEFMGTARSNLVSTLLVVQDFSQIKKNYGAEQAEVIASIAGNVISGQVTGNTAKELSERFGKIMQARKNQSVNSSDISISHSHQLESAIPPSRIAALSSGEFVGLLADTPSQPMELKMVHARVINDPVALKKEEAQFKDVPVVRSVTPEEVQLNYLSIKQDTRYIVATAMQRIQEDPSLAHLLMNEEDDGTAE